MKSIMQKSTLLLPVLLSLGHVAVAQESEADLQRQMKKVEQEISAEQAALQQQREIANQRTQRNQERIQAAQGQLAQIRANNNQLQGQINATKGQNQGLKASAAAYEAKRIALSKELVGSLDQIANSTASGFPVQKEERLARLKELRAQLLAGSLSPEEGMSRLWTFVLERNRQSVEAETWPGSYNVDGTALPGRFVRLGTTFQAFINDDNSRMFYMAKIGNEWKWVEIGNQNNTRAALLEAFAVAESKQSPKLVRIPVHVEKSK